MRATPDNDGAIDKVASDWVTLRDAGLSFRDQRKLDAWLAVDPRHLESYSRLSRTWSIFDRAERMGATNAIVTKLAIRARERRSHRVKIIAAVGAVGVALFCIHPSWNPYRSLASLLTESHAAFEPIRKLPDGSIVELNNGADIALDYESTIRRVRLLRGKAHFRVEKDAGRPFIVQVGGVEVVAVGTAFTVQAAPEAVEVIVTEGSVAVRSNENPQNVFTPTPVEPTLVEAGNHVIVDNSPEATLAPQVRAMSATEIEERLAWRIPHLEFSGMEMAQTIALLNRSNRLQIRLEDASIGKLRVSGVFRSDNPEGFVRIVEAAFELEAERTGKNEIVLRRP